MALFEKALEASVMSTHILIRANVSKSVLFEAYKIATDFEERYSAYKKESFLSEINAKAHQENVKCQPRDIELFERCHEASLLSEGEFDITIGSLSHGAYHFGFSNQKVATEKELQVKKEFVNFKLIRLDKESIAFKKKGVRLDLGGIGKGYVAKLIASYLKDRGATKLLVDVGGEIISLGKSYTIGIKNPFKDENIAYIKTSKEPMSISTSGDYERFIDSPEHNHILNKESAKSSNKYSSMTVLQNGFEIDILDAYATAMFNKDRDYIREFSKKMAMATIIIDKDSNMILNNTKELKFNSIELV